MRRERGGRQLLRTGIGGRVARALGRPGFEILNRIDDAAAELAEDRSGAGAAVLFECAAGQPEKGGRVVCADEARRDAGR